MSIVPIQNNPAYPDFTFFEDSETLNRFKVKQTIESNSAGQLVLKLLVVACDSLGASKLNPSLQEDSINHSHVFTTFQISDPAFDAAGIISDLTTDLIIKKQTEIQNREALMNLINTG